MTEQQTSPKARGAVRDHHTAIPRAVTTSMGEPCHRAHNPAIICKPAGAGEALRTQGKGGCPTYATSAAVGQADVCRKDAETPKGNRRYRELRKTAGAVGRARHMAENKRRSKDIANPTDRAPPQEQDRHMEPERLRNPRKVTCGRTRRGKPQEPQEEA